MRLAEEYGAIYIRSAKPGASRARNEGWKRARHKLVAFIDDDVRVDIGWADAFAHAATSHLDASFVTGRVGVPPRLNPEFPLALMVEAEPFRIDASTPNPIGHTANVVVRREALERIGGFDEALGSGATYRAAEDQDLFDRLFALGRVGWYAPEASATHEPWRGRREILPLEWSYGIGTGARLVKLTKGDRGRLLRVLRDNVWAVVLDAFHAIRVGFKFKVVVCCVRLAGTCVGVVRALPRRVHDGHFRAGRAGYATRDRQADQPAAR
jgi:GT2 family glycosyltransferase